MSIKFIGLGLIGIIGRILIYLLIGGKLQAFAGEATLLEFSAEIESSESPSQELLSDMGLLVSGAFNENLPPPIFYDSFIPVILQYKTPTWNKSDVTFINWGTECTSETAPYHYSCPVKFHMNNVVANLHVDFEGIHPISNNKTRKLQQSCKKYYDLLTDHSEFCEIIQKHFQSIYTDSSDLKDYFNVLKDCLNGTYVLDDNIMEYSYDIRQPFNKMGDNYYYTFYDPIYKYKAGNISFDVLGAAVLSNARTGLQGVLLAQFYAEKNRWIHANEDCRQGYLPTSLITPKYLDDIIHTVTTRLLSAGKELSIDQIQISKYYSLPLADCTHTEEAQVVRILMPTLKKSLGENLQLMHVHATPFIYNGLICQLKLPVLHELDQAPMYLYDKHRGNAYHTNCRPNELCKVSEYTLDSRRSDPCTSSLLSKNASGIRKFCDFECLLESENLLPSVTRVSLSKYVLTGSSLSMQFSCGGPSGELRDIKASGTVLVKLPCNCQMRVLELQNSFLFRGASKSGPCNADEIRVIPVMPVMFARKNTTLSDYDDDSALVNLKELADPDFKNHHKTFTDHGKIKGERNGKDIQTNTARLYGEKYVSEKSEEAGGVGGLFWSVLVVSFLVILSLQLYIIFLFRKNQKLVRKDAGILSYRVDHDDTVSLNQFNTGFQ